MHVGDRVMYVSITPLPIPRGKMRMYTPGTITNMEGKYVTVRGVCGEVTTVYDHYVKVLECYHK